MTERPQQETPIAQVQGDFAPRGAAGRPSLLDSAQLLRGQRSVEIQHNGELYRLQATRTGKLILTK